MAYALQGVLTPVLGRGLAARWARHTQQHRALKAGLERLGLRYLADPAHQLPMLNAVATPVGVDEALARRRLLDAYGIEIGGGLGANKGKAWRIGLMGESATPRHVDALLGALEELL